MQGPFKITVDCDANWALPEDTLLGYRAASEAFRILSRSSRRKVGLEYIRVLVGGEHEEILEFSLVVHPSMPSNPKKRDTTHKLIVVAQTRLKQRPWINPATKERSQPLWESAMKISYDLSTFSPSGTITLAEPLDPRQMGHALCESIRVALVYLREQKLDDLDQLDGVIETFANDRLEVSFTPNLKLRSQEEGR